MVGEAQIASSQVSRTQRLCDLLPNHFLHDFVVARYHSDWLEALIHTKHVLWIWIVITDITFWRGLLALGVSDVNSLPRRLS
jgi:hypothetical protein